MSEVNNGVEEIVQPAPVEQGVEVPDPNAPMDQEEDLQAQLDATNAELEKVRIEKENYKKGLLKAKGKLPEEVIPDEPEEDLETKIDRIVAQRLIESKETQLQKEKDEIFKKTLARNKELATALKNRSGISGIGSGTSNEGESINKPFWGKDQLEELRRKGFDVNDPKKLETLKKNLQKVKGV